jgi:hypothetical protein
MECGIHAKGVGMVAANDEKRLPPYVSYRTFRNFTIDLRQGIPSRVDRSFWGTKMAGSTGIQLMTALRFLSLIDEGDRPTEKLVRIVESEGRERQEILKGIVRDKYAFVFDSLELERATPAELGEKFKEQGAEGDVGRKCIAFFVAAANDAEIPLSPFILKKTRAARTTSRPKRAATKSPLQKVKGGRVLEAPAGFPARIAWEELLLSKFPSFDPSWPDEVKVKWFDAFDQLMRRKPAGGSEEGDKRPVS